MLSQPLLQGHQPRRKDGGSGMGAERSASFSAKARQWSRSASAARVRSSAAPIRAARSSSRTSSCAMVRRAAARSSARADSSLAGWEGGWASGGRCPLCTHWAPTHLSSSCRVICQRFRLSRNAGNSWDSMARMMVRRLTFTSWAAWAGDKWAGVGAPSGRPVGRAGQGRVVSSCRPRSRPAGNAQLPARGCSRCPEKPPLASR